MDVKVTTPAGAPPDVSPEQQAALAERIRGGDPAAEEELVHLFGRRVLVMMLARVRDREAARELANDVLVAVIQALRNGQVRQAERLAAFVHGTARNLVANHFRTRFGKPREEPLAPETALVDPVEGLERQEQLFLVRREVAGLEATDRRILLMVLVDGLKPGEIAAKLGLSPEVVRARKSRAVKKIIGKLQGLSRS